MAGMGSGFGTGFGMDADMHLNAHAGVGVGGWHHGGYPVHGHGGFPSAGIILVLFILLVIISRAFI